MGAAGYSHSREIQPIDVACLKFRGVDSRFRGNDWRFEKDASPIEVNTGQQVMFQFLGRR
jgi:hypothetical protein